MYLKTVDVIKELDIILLIIKNENLYSLRIKDVSFDKPLFIKLDDKESFNNLKSLLIDLLYFYPYLTVEAALTYVIYIQLRKINLEAYGKFASVKSHIIEHFLNYYN